MEEGLCGRVSLQTDVTKVPTRPHGRPCPLWPCSDLRGHTRQRLGLCSHRLWESGLSFPGLDSPGVALRCARFFHDS